MKIYITRLQQILSFSSPFRPFEMKNFLRQPIIFTGLVQRTASKMMFSHSKQNWKNLIQKELFADVLQNRCSKTFANFTGRHLC